MISGPRAQIKSRQRERILDAARTLFAERGVEPVTMADVALSAGVARATVFNYFASKYALVEATTDDVVAYFQGMLENALADRVTPTPALVRALFSHMGAGIEAYRGFYRGVFREIARISVGLDEGPAARRTREVTSAQLVRLMERGLARGDLRPVAPAVDLARAFESLTNGTIIGWLYDEQNDSLRQRMERAAEIFLAPVAVPRFAGRPRRLVALAAPPQDPTSDTPGKRARRAPRRTKETK
ncbi:MAG TPA: TetR/AcrR family transcriptional regulator [Myxococcota bacterium]|nr:TetR/AcrR family transcriptional regulator [Myxococcota bacterium]